MAKKKATKKSESWSIKFKEKADEISNARRGSLSKKEIHVPKIPKATLFVDGKKIVLNA